MADFDNRVARASTTADYIDAGLRGYMLRIYNYMLAGLAVTGLTSYGTFLAAVTDNPANAAALAALEGNYNGTPIDPETPLAAFKTLAAQQRFRVLDVQGAPFVEQISLPVPPLRSTLEAVVLL